MAGTIPASRNCPPLVVTSSPVAAPPKMAVKLVIAVSPVAVTSTTNGVPVGMGVLVGEIREKWTTGNCGG
ncbi:MAG: hypothetical protein BWX84_00197 [Verrucomicrobia bacterium ADurb.Bin118]|nr:MAG: hypothetical protein BWX84_00197 [Verrucomicrobia bacterium ADurb.Bin118]